MKNLKDNVIFSSLLASFLAMTLIFTLPSAVLAKDNGNGNKGNNGNGNAYGHLIAPGLNKDNNGGDNNNNKSDGNNGSFSSSNSSSSPWWDKLPWGISQRFFGFNNNNNRGNNNSSSSYRGGDNDNDHNNYGGYGYGRGGATTTPTTSGTPSVSGVTSPTVLAVNQTGTWSVQASDSVNNPLEYSVDWGDRGYFSPFALFSSAQQPFVQTSTFTHSYPRAGTYTIKFTVKDTVSGQTAASTVTVQITSTGTTTPPATTTPLTMSGLTGTAQMNQAEISWNTNMPADSEIWYGTTSPVNTSGTPTQSSDTSVYNHYLYLNNLTASTTYYYIVVSKDASGDVATSSESSFMTNVAPYSNPLSIENAVAVVGSTSVNLTWNTNIAADSEAYYSTSSPVTIGDPATTALTDATLNTAHSLNATGLATSTTYYFMIQSKDAASDTVSTGQFSVTTGSGM